MTQQNARTATHNKVFIDRIQTAQPEKSLTQAASVELMRDFCIGKRAQRLTRHIARQSGVRQRFLSALDYQDDPESEVLFQPATEQPHGPGMGKRNRVFDLAADRLIEEFADAYAESALEKVTTLVTVSCTHASAPGLEKPLFHHTGLSPAVSRWNLRFMGCSAGLAALRLVAGLRPEQQEAMVCTCELSSLHFQYTEEIDQITANLLFADGAALVSLTATPSGLAVLGARSVHLPTAADQMIWIGDDHGLRLSLARDLPDTLAEVLPATVDRFLADHGLTQSDIKHWMVHPGGPQILDSVESSLGLNSNSLDDSRTVLAECGNMSSSTIFFIMNRFMQRREAGMGMALAFGPGLTIELVLLEFDPK